MRVLIVKLSSLGDVVHAMPVVHDLRQARPGVVIDWVVEPGFAPLVRRVEGIGEVIECALRRWRKAWWTPAVRAEWRAFRHRLQREHYDAVIDLQGLTKSALVARLARGRSHGLALRTDGSSFEWPARWLVDEAVVVPRHIHAVDRSRELVGRVLGVPVEGPPRYGLQAHPAEGGPDTDADGHVDADAHAGLAARAGRARSLMVFVHGSSRDDKLWPEADWIALGRRLVALGWRIALPQAGEAEAARARRIAGAINRGDQGDGGGVVASCGEAATVWPAMALDALVDRLGAAQAVIGVDSGLSHIAVALDRPHLQLYNFPTAWRTGPQAAHGHRHQVSLQGDPVPTLDAVWQAWQGVAAAAGLGG